MKRRPLPQRRLLAACITLMLAPLAPATASAQDRDNTGLGAWFTATNWSGDTLPTASTDARINNGGTANANSVSAPGNMVAQNLDIGVDGGTGSLESDGVDLELQFPLQIGLIQPSHDSGGTANGQAVFTDGAILPWVQDDFDDVIGALHVGAAYTTGEGIGRLEVSDGAVPAQTIGINVGYVETLEGDIDAIASANGTLVLRSTAITDSQVLQIGGVDTEAVGSSGTATAFVTIEDTTTDSRITIGQTAADAENSAARSATTVTLTDFTGPSRLKILDVDVISGATGGVAQGTAEVNLLRVNYQTTSDLDIAECAPNATDSEILPSRVDITVADSTLQSRLIDLAEMDANGNGIGDCTVVMTVTGSSLISTGTGLTIADSEARTESQGRSTASLTMDSSTLETTTLDIGLAFANGTSVAVADGSLTMIDSTATVGTRARVGRWADVEDNSTATGNSVTARLALEGSALETQVLEIGADNGGNFPLDAEVSLNPSVITTGDLLLGPTSRIVMAIEGPTRARDDNLDQSGLYAAIDTLTATLEGEVIVEINYGAQAGETFDLIQADPGVLSNSDATFRFTGAPESAATLEVVTEGADVLRLTVTQDLSPPAPAPGPGGGRLQPVPVDQPLALTLLVLLMGWLGAGLLRNRASRLPPRP